MSGPGLRGDPGQDVGPELVQVSPAEQRRRWLLKSLLRRSGVDAAGYRARFGTAHTDDFPQLAELTGRGWLDDSRCVLTADGLARSDASAAALRTAGAAVERGSLDDLDGLLARLAESGIEPEKPPYAPGGREEIGRICFVADPDGYRIELIDGGEFATPQDD